MSSAISLRPLISVVMPVYNRQEYVGEAIQSILAQTYSNFEFIIVDDGSTDETPRLIREYADRDARIHLLFLEHGGGPRAANAGIAQARGELIARMDSDDISLPQRFAVQLDWLRQHELDVCGSSALFFGEAAGPAWFPETHAVIRHELLFRVSLLHPTVVVRSEILRAQPYAETAHHDDYELWTRLAPKYRLGNVPQILLKHRVHPQQSLALELKEFQQDFRTYGRRCFRDLFPRATPQDWARYERSIKARPIESVAELRGVGSWLAELARLPDRLFHQQLARRWEKTCRASAALGAEHEKIYREVLPQINPNAQPGDYLL
jgi:glycosyltransferase involved in cell wall biosynthesis